MTPIIVDIRNRIVELSGLSNASVGFGTLPNGTALPYIAVAEISPQRGYTHDGFDGTVQTVIQANIYTKGYQEAKTLQQVLKGLDEQTSEHIAGIKVNAQEEGFDNTVDRHSTGLDFMIYHYE